MSWFVESLRENPELAIFLTLAIGFVIGRLRIGGFSLGNVVGTLLAGVLVGQLDIDVDPVVKLVFFDLFLFATCMLMGIGYLKGLGVSELWAANPAAEGRAAYLWGKFRGEAIVHLIFTALFALSLSAQSHRPLATW